MKITIDITRQDVDNAVKAQLADSMCSFTGCCPVAQAMMRIFPNKRILVGSSAITVGNTEYYYAVKASDMRAVTSLGKRDWVNCGSLALTSQTMYEASS